MVMMAFLGQPDFGLEPEDLLAILAHLAVHQIGAFTDFDDPVGEGFEHLRVVVQIGRFHKLDVRVVRCDHVRVIIDALDQNAGEQEIRKHHDPPVAEFDGVLEGWLDERKGHTGIGGFAPAETKAFAEHARNLGHIGIGVRVRGTTSDSHQHGLVQWNLALLGIRSRDGLHYAIPGGADHLEINAQFPAIHDIDPGILGRIGVQDRGNVILGVPGGKQHAGDRVNAFHASGDQLVEPVANDGGSEFQKAVLDMLVCETRPQSLGYNRKLPNCTFVTAAVTAHHNSEIVRHNSLL